MKDFNIFWDELLQNKLVESAIVIIASILIYTIIHHLVIRGERKSSHAKLGRGRTYIKLILSIVRYVFIILTILAVLQVNGVDVSSILAGLGLVGVIIGLAVQDALKDIIRGFSIISDRYFSVGDVIKFNNDQEGIVTEIGLRSVKLKSITNGCEVTIANREIQQAERCANSTAFKLPLPYELKLSKAEELIAEIIEEIKQNEDVTDATYLGVSDLEDSAILYLVTVKTKAEQRRKVRRAALRTSLEVLEKHHISVPYKQIDLHRKN